jgi:hypothetical protein
MLLQNNSSTTNCLDWISVKWQRNSTVRNRTEQRQIILTFQIAVSQRSSSITATPYIHQISSCCYWRRDSIRLYRSHDYSLRVSSVAAKFWVIVISWVQSSTCLWSRFRLYWQQNHRSRVYWTASPIRVNIPSHYCEIICQSVLKIRIIHTNYYHM